MTDYTAVPTPDLQAELDRQAGIQEAAGIERRAIADELRAREQRPRVADQLVGMADADKVALFDALQDDPAVIAAAVAMTAKPLVP